jgi:hypothetical protein
VSGVLRYFGPASTPSWRGLRRPTKPNGSVRPSGVPRVMGEDESVPEPVDDPSVAGGGGQAGLGELEVGCAVAAQVADEVGPSGGCVAGLHVRVAGQVGPYPLGEVGLSPRAGEALGVEVQRDAVQLENPRGADRGGVGVVGAGQLRVDLAVGGRQDAGELAGSRCPGQGAGDVVAALRPVGRVGGDVEVGLTDVGGRLVLCIRGLQVLPLLLGGRAVRLVEVVPEGVGLVVVRLEVRPGWPVRRRWVVDQ